MIEGDARALGSEKGSILMTPEAQAREIVSMVSDLYAVTTSSHRAVLIQRIAAVLAAKDAEIKRLKTAYGALAPVAIELRTQRDALYQAALAFCHSIETKLKHGRASQKEIALEREVRCVAIAAGS